jgi:uncharacterized protein (DUF305 family)
MKIFAAQIPAGVLLSTALLSVTALPASAQDPPASVVQPGAPGQPTRTLTEAEVSALRQPVHVEADVRFMQGMTFHHAQALQMTGLLSSRTESDEIRLLAQRIDISQTAEMGMMEGWLESRGEEAPDLEDEDVWPLSDDRLMPGMLTERQMGQLAAATGEEFDRLFLELMILHHEGALAMVEQLYVVSGAAQEPQIFQFLTHVDADQSIEIARMNTMLLAIR